MRSQDEAALEAARQIKAHAPHCRGIFTVYEMKRLGRNSAEQTAPADHLTAHGIVSEMLAGRFTGIYDPTGTGAGCCSRSSPRWPNLNARTSAKPPSRAFGSTCSSPPINAKVATPGLASIYRVLSDHEKPQAHLDAVGQAHTDFAALHRGTRND